MTDAKYRHPSREQLSDFALGKLDDSQIAVVAGHLSDCAVCRDAATCATDGFLELLRPDAGDTQDALLYQPLAQSLSLPHHSQPRPGRHGVRHLAEHRMMKQLRAVKVVNSALIGSPNVSERFVREIELLSRLHHPAIVQGFDAERVGELYLLVMEYVEGMSWLRSSNASPLPIGVACDYTQQAALGLQYAHEQGLVHRDIKPSNLMLRDGGRIKTSTSGWPGLPANRASRAG